MALDFDSILDEIGQFKKYQKLYIVLMLLATIPVGLQNLLYVFAAGIPRFQCNNTIINLSTNNTWEHCKGTVCPNQCDDREWDLAANETEYSFDNDTVSQCNIWVYDESLYGANMVTKYDLVCSRSWLRPLIQSLYVLGYMCGACFFGFVSDRIGRLPTWYITLSGIIVFGCGSAFIPGYWGNVITRMISAVFVSGSFMVSFVFIVEVVGPDYRMIPGILTQCGFAFGYILMTGMAYGIRNYWFLQLAVSLVPILIIPYFLAIRESPRWLLATGKIDKAKAEIKRAAKMNDTAYPEHLFDKNVGLLVDKEEDSKTYFFTDLLRTSNLRFTSLNVFFNWLVCALVYYGLSLGVSDLPGGPYLNMVISGIMEILGCFVCIAILDRLGRRLSLALFMLVGGVACMLMPAVPYSLDVLKIVLSAIGKLSLSASFASIYVYSAEVFPTVVRNNGVGAGSMSARIGGFIAPFIADLSRVWMPLPFIIYGVLALIAGVLCFLLPETLRQHLPETLEDGERFAGKNMRCCCRSKALHTNDKPDNKSDTHPQDKEGNVIT